MQQVSGSTPKLSVVSGEFLEQGGAMVCCSSCVSKQWKTTLASIAGGVGGCLLFYVLLSFSSLSPKQCHSAQPFMICEQGSRAL